MTAPIASGDYLYPHRLNRPTTYRAANPAPQTGVTVETVSLTVPGVVFRARWAYEAVLRTAVYGTANAQVLFRIRADGLTGTDWGEYGRVTCVGPSAGQSAMANGTLVLLRSGATDSAPTDVVLTIAPSAGATVNAFASAASPRYLVIRPCGPASEYAGCGVEVS